MKLVEHVETEDRHMFLMKLTPKEALELASNLLEQLSGNGSPYTSDVLGLKPPHKSIQINIQEDALSL